MIGLNQNLNRMNWTDLVLNMFRTRSVQLSSVTAMWREINGWPEYTQLHLSLKCKHDPCAVQIAYGISEKNPYFRLRCRYKIGQTRRASVAGKCVHSVVLDENVLCGWLTASFHHFSFQILMGFHYWSPLPSSRHQLSFGDYLEDKRENYQNCSVLCCVRQLYVLTHTSSS